MQRDQTRLRDREIEIEILSDRASILDEILTLASIDPLILATEIEAAHELALEMDAFLECLTCPCGYRGAICQLNRARMHEHFDY